MKKMNKKKGLQLVATLLVISIMVGAVGYPPLFAQAKVTTDMFIGEDNEVAGNTPPVENSPSITQGVNGVDVNYSDTIENTNIVAHTVTTRETYDVLHKGVHLEVDNIKGRSDNLDAYSFMVFMGTNTHTYFSSQNYADDSIAMAFSSNGYYKIWHTDYSGNAINPSTGWESASILAKGQLRKGIVNDYMTLDVKVQNGTYYIVVNGEEIRFAFDSSKGLTEEQLQAVRLGFHVWGPVSPTTYSCDYDGKGPWSTGGEPYGASYTIVDLVENYRPTAIADMFESEDDDDWAFTAPIEKSPSFVSGTNGVEVSYSSTVENNAIAEHTITTRRTYDVLNKGIHLEVSNLKGHAANPDEYSFMIYMGTNTNTWFSSQNYADDNIAMAFSSNGYYKIWHTDYSSNALNPDTGWNAESILAVGQFSESLADNRLKLDMKVQDDMYCIIVNGTEIKFALDESKGLTKDQLQNARLGFHVWGPVSPTTYSCAYNGKGPWDNGGQLGGVSYTIETLTEGLSYILVEEITMKQTKMDMTVGETATLKATLIPMLATGGVTWQSSDDTIVLVDEQGNMTALQEGSATVTAKSDLNGSIYARCKIHVYGARQNGVPDGFYVIGDETNPSNWYYQMKGETNKFIFGQAGQGWERVSTTNTYNPASKDMYLELSDISSTMSDEAEYSVVIAFGNSAVQWYGTNGYLLVYGKNSGNLAIFATAQGNNALMADPIVVWDEREPLGDTLIFKVKLVDDNYEISLNGKTYLVPAKYEVNPISNPQKLYLSFGIMSDFDFTENEEGKQISNLDYYSDLDIGEISFIVRTESGTSDITKRATLKPFAGHFAFMTGDENGKFRPEESMTRAEAVAIMAELLVDKDDIEDVYSSDFSDIKTEDACYDSVAYMERNGFLPDFGEKFLPDQAITRGELVALLLDEKDITEGIPITDVDVQDELYGNICYAIDFDMFELDLEGKFCKDAVVTRGEAAKVFCKYLEKAGNISNPETTFKDVDATTEYADYILLAANEIGIYRETIQATSTNTIQECIEQAIVLSKTKDAIVTIELTEDVYVLSESVTIEGSAYGAHELVIVLKSAEGKSPMISGNADMTVSAFVKVEGKEYYSYQLPETAKVAGNWPAFRDLYLNGERLQLARSDEYVFEQTIKNPTYGEDGTTLTGGDNGFYVDNASLGDISTESMLSPLELCINIEWVNKRWRVSTINNMDETTGLTELSIHEEDYQDYLAGDGNKRHFTGWTYWFENHLTLLDEPGEFYYDRANGVIYFYPYENTDMSNAVVSYPTVEKLFDMKNVSGVVFEGITFTGITSNFATEHGFSGFQGGVHAGTALIHENIHSAAIYSDYSSHITVRNCTFDELGGNGVYMNGGNNNTVIKGSSFTDIAMCAVVFGKHDQVWNFEHGQSNLIIDNNYIYDIGTDYSSCPAIHIPRVKNVAVTHNTMIHTPYSGLHIGWIGAPAEVVNVHNAEVAYNHCEDNMYALNDGSPLYFAGANALTDNATILNRVHHNFIKSTGYTGTYNGVYLDMNASNYKVYQNVIDGFVTKHGPVYNQYIEGQYTYNNIVQNNYVTMSSISADGNAADRGVLVSQNHKVASYDKLPAEALAIIDVAGQKDAYAKNVPIEDTEIKMIVENPHITLRKAEVSEDAAVVFSITNNSSNTASYTVERTNSGDVKITTFPETLQLAAGESGTIMVKFQSDVLNPSGERIDLNVVQDNGWKMEYKRVIDVAVGYSYTATKIDESKNAPSCEENKDGVKVTYGFNTNQGSRVTCNDAYTVEGDGIDIEITDISSTKPLWGSQDTDYSIAIMIGGGSGAWFSSTGYMIVYGKSGTFKILQSTDGNLSPDVATVLVSDSREALADNGSLSINIRMIENGDTDSYSITVNGKSYEVSTVQFAHPEKLYVSAGAMGDRTSSSDTYMKTFVLSSVVFTIAEVSDNRAGNIVFDYTDTFSTYRKEMTAPEAKDGYIFAGWYYDAQCTDLVSSETVSLNSNQRVYAKFVDKDVLSAKMQFTAGTTSSSTKTDLRLVTSVDCLDYANAGFIITNSAGTSKTYWQTTAYTSLYAANILYEPDVFSACSTMFITLKLTGLKVAGSDLERETTVQPCWETHDGTIVAGWARTFTIQEGLDAINK